MVCRAVPTAKQRSLIEELFAIGDLVLTVKHGEHAAVNLHGTFELVDKTWTPEQVHESTNLTETLIGLLASDGTPRRTSTGEPLAHLHVCWPDVRWVLFKPMRLDTIGTDHVVRFCRSQDEGSWIFAFYTVGSPSYDLLVERQGTVRGWVSSESSRSSWC